MRKATLWLGLSAAVLGLSTAASGQGRFQVGVFFEPYFPQGEFQDISDRIGWGGSLDLLYSIPRSALHVGVAFAYHVYGYESRWEPLSWSIPDVLIKVSTTNALIRGHAVMRLQPQVGRMRPYFEGLIGLQHLTTDTRANDPSDWEDESIASTNHSRSTVFSYGLGGGLMLNLYRSRNPDPRRGFSVDLEAGVRYIRGGSAEYLTPGDIEVKEWEITYYVNRSRTDFLAPRLGVSFSF